VLTACAVVLLGGALAGSDVSAAQGLRRLSLKEKVGQLVMFSVDGPALSAVERDLIARNHLGGVILFADNYRNPNQLERLTSQIQRAARRGSSLRLGALISVDQEGGVVKRFPDMPPHYSAPQMGRIGRKSLAYKQGRATARALRSAGVNIDLAPVADLDLPPEHVMRSRSFGSNPYRVARLVQAFGRGLQSARVGAVLKHFPGLGGATQNSDFGRSYVYRSKRQLHRIDAIPFHRAIDRGVRLVMLSHAMYVHDGGRRPASVNRHIATRRLRRGFGFEGVAISDALEPVSWKFGGSVPRACAATVRAGVDVALITGNVFAARSCANAIRTGVKTGQIPERRVDRAVTRVLELKAWLRLIGSV
jgi:beta-N-acetylhexosaminidase